MSLPTLSREQEKALNFFLLHHAETNSDKMFANTKKLKKSAPLLESGFMASSYVPFKKSKLPREKHWAWNQSNSKISVKLQETKTIVTFRKISPRKRFDKKAPSYKSWLYHIHSQPEIYFLWCEKGTEAVVQGISTEIGTIFPHLLSITSLSFLVPFVDEKTAVEFGWIDTSTL